jgi:Mn2+/Fe2+ NRAMP family transporter
LEFTDMREPPANWFEALKLIGPGIVLAGTIVGSGELILTTGIGAKHGFAFLWLVLFSCVIKVFVQVELGRYAISSGMPTLQALKTVTSVRAVGMVLLIWWLIMLLCTVFQLGGMTGGVAQSLNMAFPNLWADLPAIGPWLQKWPEIPWAFLTCFITVALIYRGSYRRIEWFTTLLVISITCLTVLAAIALIWTPFAPSSQTVISGLACKIPSAGVADAFAVFGITGVGATELFYYPYWCLEKGYAKYVGPNDGSQQWQQRAQGWIKVMYLDAWISMVVFTLSTVAFYSMGAAVLHPQGLNPAGTQMISTLSEMYSGPFGNWTKVVFLVGAGAVLFKTLYLACAANSRLMVDFLGVVETMPDQSESNRNRWIARFCMGFPVLALTFYVFQRDPQLMVKVGGLAQAATLPMIALVTLFFRYKRLTSTISPGKAWDLCLWIATAAIVSVAIYSIPDSLRQIWAIL